MAFFKFKKKNPYEGGNGNTYQQERENKIAEKKDRLFEEQKSHDSDMENLDKNIAEQERIMAETEKKYL